jgi:hypothetical protein
MLVCQLNEIWTYAQPCNGDVLVLIKHLMIQWHSEAIRTTDYDLSANVGNCTAVQVVTRLHILEFSILKFNFF